VIQKSLPQKPPLQQGPSDHKLGHMCSQEDKHQGWRRSQTAQHNELVPIIESPLSAHPSRIKLPLSESHRLNLDSNPSPTDNLTNLTIQGPNPTRTNPCVKSFAGRNLVQGVSSPSDGSPGNRLHTQGKPGSSGFMPVNYLVPPGNGSRESFGSNDDLINKLSFGSSKISSEQHPLNG
jgi:hypothetical protein